MAPKKKQNECLEGAVPPQLEGAVPPQLLTNGDSLMGKSLTVFKTYRSIVDAHLLYIGK
jgi:hypothetical protein